MQPQSLCFKCSEVLSVGSSVGFKDSCHRCDSDIHCCRNCNFYDTSAYNYCKENQADRVVDKEKANFCDYFRLRTGGGPASKPAQAPTAMSSLDALFKKS